jgi:hypothetical protein
VSHRCIHSEKRRLSRDRLDLPSQTPPHPPNRYWEILFVPRKKGNAVSQTSPVFLSETEIALVIESLLLAEEVHLAKAQIALKAEALDECYQHLQASEAAHALAECISGRGT